MDPKALYRIEKLNYALGAIAAAVGFLVLPRPAALGLLVGAGIGAVNFTLIRGLVERTFAAVKSGTGARSAALIFPKMLGLLGVVFFALYLLPISPIYLAIGFSIVFLSIAIETVRFALTGPKEGQGDDEGTEHHSTGDHDEGSF